MASSNRNQPSGTGDSSDRPYEEEDPHFMCIPGLGGPANRPKPRVLGTSFFGYVPDAYSMKSPSIPSERSSSPPPAIDKTDVKANNSVRHFFIQKY